jgi:uncharacterized protein
MSFLVVAVVALFTSALTLFSGFGLGTLLFPAFALFFPSEVAVAAKAVVHAANNVLKAVLLGKNADRAIVLRFGIPAIAASFVGAGILVLLAKAEPLFAYTIWGRNAEVTALNLVLALLMFVFALVELLPRFSEMKFDRKYLPVGGVLSGFFGGVSGHQGALRAAFLAKSGISTQAYVATNAVIALMVDSIRIAVYAVTILRGTTGTTLERSHWALVLTGILAAFAGVVIGRRFMHKVTMRSIQILTGILLILIAIALAMGLI